MPFTPAQFPLLSAQQASPFGNLIQNALSNYTNAVQAHYAPKLLQSQIFGQQFAPLAQIASSPLALAMLPDQRQQMVSLISKLLQQTDAPNANSLAPTQNNSSVQNNPILPSTNIQQGGSPDAPNANSLPPTQNNSSVQNNPNLPSPNIQQGAQQKMTGTYAEQIHPPGMAYITLDGRQMVPPTIDNVAQAQKAITSIDMISKLMPQIKSDGQEFTAPESKLDTMRSGISTVLNKWGLPGEIVSDDPDKAGRYTTYKAEVTQAADLLKLIFPNAQSTSLFNRYEDMLAQHPTDSGKAYTDRMDKIVNELQMQIRPSIQEQMGSTGGYDLNATGQLAVDLNKYVVGISQDGKKVKMRTPDGAYWNIPNDPDTIDKALRLIEQQMGAAQPAGAKQ